MALGTGGTGVGAVYCDSLGCVSASLTVDDDVEEVIPAFVGSEKDSFSCDDIFDHNSLNSMLDLKYHSLQCLHLISLGRFLHVRYFVKACRLRVVNRG